MKIKPRNDKVIVKRHRAEEAEESELVIPNNIQDFDESFKGKVISVGPGRKREDGGRYPMSVDAGDEILYKQYAGHKIKRGDEEENYWLISEKDILAVIEE